MKHLKHCSIFKTSNHTHFKFRSNNAAVLQTPSKTSKPEGRSGLVKSHSCIHGRDNICSLGLCAGLKLYTTVKSLVKRGGPAKQNIQQILSIANLSNGDNNLSYLAVSHWLRTHPGKLQAETRDQQGACAFYPDVRLCPCDPARQDEQQWEVWKVL